MQKLRVCPLVLCFFLLSLAFHQHALGADATSFDPTKVAVKAKGAGGVPVGMILAWPVGENPEDMDNWLECNGQSISQSVYPELFALMGAQVPDLRGLFLRGHGGNSGSLGVIQGDAIRNITGSIAIYEGGNAIRASGAFSGEMIQWGVSNLHNYGERTSPRATLDASRVVPTAEENRPVNMAVRYFIRAHP